MPGEFSEAGIVDVRIIPDDADLIVSWSTDGTIPDDSYFQLYVNKSLKWSGPEHSAVLPGLNVAGVPLALHVGTVGEGNRLTSYAGTLGTIPGGGNRALLQWYGGGWERGVDAYMIFCGPNPGTDPDMVNPLATVKSQGPAGFGRGPFGVGPFGHGSRRYRWTSGPLPSGEWRFRIVPATMGGIRSDTYTTLNVTIIAPPAGPKAVNGKKVWISSFDQTTGQATIQWKY